MLPVNWREQAVHAIFGDLVSQGFGSVVWASRAVLSWLNQFVRPRPAPVSVPASCMEILMLARKMKGMTALASNEYLRRHRGKRLTIRGPILQVEPARRGIVGVPIKQRHGYTAVLEFAGQRRRLTTLNKGQIITVSGSFYQLDPDKLTLRDCKILEVADK